MISELVLLNTLRVNQWNLTKLCVCIIIDKDWVGIVRHQSAQICIRVMTFYSICIYALIMTRSDLRLLCVDFWKFSKVMTLDLCQNFVSAKYLNNEWMEFNKI